MSALNPASVKTNPSFPTNFNASGNNRGITMCYISKRTCMDNAFLLKFALMLVIMYLSLILLPPHPRVWRDYPGRRTSTYSPYVRASQSFVAGFGLSFCGSVWSLYITDIGQYDTSGWAKQLSRQVSNWWDQRHALEAILQRNHRWNWTGFRRTSTSLWNSPLISGSNAPILPAGND